MANKNAPFGLKPIGKVGPENSNDWKTKYAVMLQLAFPARQRMFARLFGTALPFRLSVNG